jgi:hypothetical protein
MIRDAAYYDLVGRAIQGLAPDFDTFVNSIFADKYNSTTLPPNFAWDANIQMDYTYDQLLMETGVYAMATYVDTNSDAPYRSPKGAQLASGKIPTLKHGFKLDEKIMREQMILAQRGIVDGQMNSTLQDLLFMSVDKLIGGNYNSIAYQRHQAVSTGKLALLDANNPQGITNVDFDFKVPAGNVTTLVGTARWWTDTAYTTEGSTANPLADLVALVKAAEDAYAPFAALEVSKRGFTRAMGHSKMLISLGYLYNPLAADDTAAANVARQLSTEQMRQILSNKLGVEIRIIDKLVAAEKYDKATKKIVAPTISAFNEDAWVLVPDGELGTIKAVAPIIIPDPAARLATFDGGRTLITQTFNAKQKIQYIESEMSVLCVPNRVTQMFYLNIK